MHSVRQWKINSILRPTRHAIGSHAVFEGRLISGERKWRLFRLTHGKDRRKLQYRILPKSVKTKVGIVGAPLVYGQPLAGTNAAPGLLRDSGLIERLLRKGAKVKDEGDLVFDIVADDLAVVPGCKYARTVGRANEKIASAVSDTVRNGRRCLLLGGDHSVGLGSVSGHANIRQDAVVIWVDAHADINTPLTTSSGNIHGMPVAFLMKELPHLSPPVPGMEWCKPCITAKQLAYIGLRSVDPGERKFIRDLNICAFTVCDVRRLGIDYVMKTVLHTLDPEQNRPIHLSFDVDALDPSLIPATGTPVPNGLTLREGLRIAKIIHATGRLSVMDVVELNPMLSSRWAAYWSADVIVEIILRTFCGTPIPLPWDDKHHHRCAGREVKVSKTPQSD